MREHDMGGNVTQGKSRNALDDIAHHFSEDEGFENVLMKYKILSIGGFCIGSMMLDIGCGVGMLTKSLSVKFKHVIGIDGSEIKIAKALKHNMSPNITYVCTLFEDYRPATSADFIVSTNVLEHVDNPITFLKQVKKWLSPHGQVVMTVPNALGLHKRIGKAMGLITDYYDLSGADLMKGHKRIYDSKKLRNDFVRSGYRIKHIGGILLKPLSHKQMESWDPAIVDALYEVGKELPDLCSSLIIVAGHK
jgi:2-polyprenyl-3-methyl-5-hydroxy-6-metoxy-1,4-benzoquinol methylase